MMKHWFVDNGDNLQQSWQEAFPEAQIVDRYAVTPGLFDGGGVVWWRLRAGENVETLLVDAPDSMDCYSVLMCDLPDDELVAKAFMLGAAGCCNTHAAPQVLRQIAAVVGNGGLWVGKSLLANLVRKTTNLLQKRNSDFSESTWEAALSDREIQVAKLVSQGANNREVAHTLHISERTVKAHLSAIFEKLGVRDRLQLSLRVNGLDS